MRHTPLITSRRVPLMEGFAWYWLWSGTVCLWLVPAARQGSPSFGWPPLWLVGAPLVLLVTQFLISSAQNWRSGRTRRTTPAPARLMTPADVAAVAQRLRPPAPSQTARLRARRKGQKLATVALLGR